MSKNIKCLVIDDEKLARTLIINYMDKLSDLELVGQCKDSFEALAILQKQQVDLIFIDIQMPELTGIELLKTLQKKPLVIFTTAYEEFAIEAFQLDAVDYLLKPFRFNRFVQAINKAARRLQIEINFQHQNNQFSLPNNEEKSFILVKSSHTVHKIFFTDILYVKGMKEYVAFHLSNRRIISLMSLKQLEDVLPMAYFMRIHKSYIISKNKVTAMDGNNIHIEKEQIPIGGNYKELVQKWFL